MQLTEEQRSLHVLVRFPDGDHLTLTIGELYDTLYRIYEVLHFKNNNTHIYKELKAMITALLSNDVYVSSSGVKYELC